MNTIKLILLVLYWLPATMRTIWKHTNGGFFIFRDECNEFLRYVLWGVDEDTEASESLADYFQQCRDEIAMRQRRGEWAC